MKKTFYIERVSNMIFCSTYYADGGAQIWKSWKVDEFTQKKATANEKRLMALTGADCKFIYNL